MRILPQSLFFIACCGLLASACGRTDYIDQSAADGGAARFHVFWGTTRHQETIVQSSTNVEQQPDGGSCGCTATAADPCALKCSTIELPPTDCGLGHFPGLSILGSDFIPPEYWAGGTLVEPDDPPSGGCPGFPGGTATFDPITCIYTKVFNPVCGESEVFTCNFYEGTCSDEAPAYYCEGGGSWVCNGHCSLHGTIKRVFSCPRCQGNAATKSVQPPVIVSTAASPAGQTQWQFGYLGYVDYQVSGSGVVSATLDGTPFAQASVTVGGAGGLTISGSSAQLPVAVDAQTIRFAVPPSQLGLDQNFAVHYESSAGASPADEQQVVSTLLDRKATLPPCNTFVHEVGVTDGHLVQVAEDLKIAGRGGGLSFTRTYSSGASGEGPLGSGWNHNYRAFLIEVPGASQYVVVGGEGNGQTFSCGLTGCKPQPGYHGSLTINGNSSFVFRSKYGTRYEFGALVAGSFPSRHRLERIVDAVGNATQLEYEEGQWGGEVRRVWEAGGGRYLEFAYTTIPGPCLFQNGQLVRLASVTLMTGGANPGGGGNTASDVAPYSSRTPPPIADFRDSSQPLHAVSEPRPTHT